jgi:hypothetical protein
VPGIILEFYTQCWFGIISRNQSRERWKTLEKKSRQENTRASRVLVPGILSVLLFGKKGCERGWGRNAGKGLERVGFVWFSRVLDGFGAHAGPCWVRWVPCLQGG